jgi:hypothetical protein
MRYRWLFSIGLCAATVWGIRGIGASPGDVTAVAHVAELAGGNLGGDVTRAQYRYLHSQPHHWRQLVIKN